MWAHVVAKADERIETTMWESHAIILWQQINNKHCPQSNSSWLNKAHWSWSTFYQGEVGRRINLHAIHSIQRTTSKYSHKGTSSSELWRLDHQVGCDWYLYTNLRRSVEESKSLMEIRSTFLQISLKFIKATIIIWIGFVG